MFCYWINPDRFTERRARMEKLLSTLRFDKVERVAFNEVEENRCNTMTRAHLEAISVIEENNLFPALLLEDDVALMGSLYNWKIPKECDLLYLGGSNYLSGTNDFKVESYNKDFFRVKGMLSAHAILIPNKRGLAVLKGLYKVALSKGGFNDMELAQNSHKHIFLAPRTGFAFYQDDYTKEVTKFTLKIT